MKIHLKIEYAFPGFLNLGNECAKIKNQFLIFANLFAKLLEIHGNSILKSINQNAFFPPGDLGIVAKKNNSCHFFLNQFTVSDVKLKVFFKNFNNNKNKKFIQFRNVFFTLSNHVTRNKYLN
jgi:hypothetical protein